MPAAAEGCHSRHRTISQQQRPSRPGSPCRGRERPYRGCKQWRNRCSHSRVRIQYPPAHTRSSLAWSLSVMGTGPEALHDSDGGGNRFKKESRPTTPWSSHAVTSTSVCVPSASPCFFAVPSRGFLSGCVSAFIPETFRGRTSGRGSYLSSADARAVAAPRRRPARCVHPSIIAAGQAGSLGPPVFPLIPDLAAGHEDVSSRFEETSDDAVILCRWLSSVAGGFWRTCKIQRGL